MPWLGQDLERLARFRRGDPTTLTETYKVYCADVARFLASGFTLVTDSRSLRVEGVRAPFELEDVVQETFVRAFSESARWAFDGERPFGTWLAAIARNVAIDRVRSAHRRARLEMELREHGPSEPADQGSTHWTASDVKVMEHELTALLKKFAASLPADLAAVWHHRFEHGEARATISEALGLSAMQLRGREQKIRRALITFLDDSGFEFEFGDSDSTPHRAISLLGGPAT